MRSFTDDLAGAIFDILKLVCYYLAGVLIVSVVLYALVAILNLITGN